jgi:hypothetical protein
MPRQHPRAKNDQDVEEVIAAPCRPSASLRTLVAGLVDYAGLFPPASLSMPDAVAEYAAHRVSPDSWILGRFIVPAMRLDELDAAAASCLGSRANPWRLAALVGDDAPGDAARIATFNAAHAGSLLVDVVEAKATSAERVDELARLFTHATCTLYVEVPHAAEPRPLLDAIRRASARAKIRTGGTTADAFPTSAHIARFIATCAELQLPFKATAGLHHPLRGEHRLTYANDAPSGTMFGFLNVFMAGALAATGAHESELAAVLEERQPAAFRFDADGARWRDMHVPLARLAEVRASFAIAFGSCSFREPVDDLRELALL